MMKIAFLSSLLVLFATLVQAANNPDSPPPYFVDPMGLMWTSSDNGTSVNWYEATEYCSKLVVGEFGSWRLPTNLEMHRLYGLFLKRRGAPLPISSSARKSFLWTSTRKLDHHDRTKEIDEAYVFHLGTGDNVTPSIEYRDELYAPLKALCVRSTEDDSVAGDEADDLGLRTAESPEIYWLDISYKKAKSQDFLGALKAIDKSLAADPKHPGALLLKGNILANLGRNDEALTFFLTAATAEGEKAPGASANAFYYAGIECKLGGELNRAVEYLSRCIFSDYQNKYDMKATCLLALAKLYRQVGGTSLRAARLAARAASHQGGRVVEENRGLIDSIEADDARIGPPPVAQVLWLWNDEESKNGLDFLFEKSESVAEIADRVDEILSDDEEKLFIVRSRDKETGYFTLWHESMEETDWVELDRHIQSINYRKGRLFAVVADPEEILEIEPYTGKVLRRNSIGGRPTSVAVISGKTDSAFFYLPGNPGLTRLDLSSGISYRAMGSGRDVRAHPNRDVLFSFRPLDASDTVARAIYPGTAQFVQRVDPIHDQVSSYSVVNGTLVFAGYRDQFAWHDRGVVLSRDGDWLLSVGNPSTEGCSEGLYPLKALPSNHLDWPEIRHYLPNEPLGATVIGDSDGLVVATASGLTVFDMLKEAPVQEIAGSFTSGIYWSEAKRELLVGNAEGGITVFVPVDLSTGASVP